MFFDMVTRCDEFRGFAKAFNRPLRVATMCSGTESPLLALEMISKACQQQHDTDFKVRTSSSPPSLSSLLKTTPSVLCGSLSL